MPKPRHAQEAVKVAALQGRIPDQDFRWLGKQGSRDRGADQGQVSD
jgi:hypothetical protein